MLSFIRIKLVICCFPFLVNSALAQIVTADSTAKCTQIAPHLRIRLCYNEDYEQALWVAYSLGKNQLEKPRFERTNNFVIDPIIRTQSAQLDDYYKSGFDRGHLAPAADFADDLTAMQQSFYMSNMSPQLPQFNRGIWKTLETSVRAWAYNYDSIAVFVGPHFSSTTSINSIGDSKVAVPSHFYKAIYRFENGQWQKSIAFLLPQDSSIKKEELLQYAISVEELEQVIGFDLFYTLPDSIESFIENQREVEEWPVLNYTSTNKQNTNAHRCLGTTQSNQQCSRVIASGLFCYQHIQQEIPLLKAEQCVGITKQGVRCKNTTKNGNRRCYQHPYTN